VTAESIERIGELACLGGQKGAFLEAVELLAATPGHALRRGVVAGEHLDAPRRLHGVPGEQGEPALVHLGDGLIQ